MIRHKKRYLYTGEPVPRRTEYRQRRKAQLEQTRRNRDSDTDNDENPKCQTGRPLERPQLIRNSKKQTILSSDSDETVLGYDSSMLPNNNMEFEESPSRLHSENSDQNCSNTLGYKSASQLSDNIVESEENPSQLLAQNSEQSDRSEESSSFALEDHSSEFSQDSPRPVSPSSIENRNNMDNPCHTRNFMGVQNNHIDNPLNLCLEGRPELNSRLCQCTSTTEGDAFLMCLTLGMRHNLSWLAIVDTLKLINRLFDSDVVSATKHYLLKYLEVGKENTTFHIVCPNCESYITERPDIPQELITCDICEKQVNCSDPSSFFLSIDVESQIKMILNTPDLANEIMTYRFERSKMNEEAFEDIYDGHYYKQLQCQGLLDNPLNFSYTFNTDGVNLGKSSFQSVWPIFLSINELSPQNRKTNIVLAGLWVGRKDPNMPVFLKPFVEIANRLSSDGLTWKNFEGEEKVSKVYPLCMVVDSGARYKILNMSSFHAYWGCTFCYHISENTKCGRRFTVKTGQAPPRTHESIKQDMLMAFRNKDNKDKKRRLVKGTKGPSALIAIQHFDIGRGVVVDFMHSVLLGNSRSITLLMLNSFGENYYVGTPSKVFVIDKRLQHIKTPTSITRAPRKLKEVKLWKASEWRSWLLFYSVVCLQGILKDIYLAHLSMLSSAIFILLQKSITFDDIQLAKKYLLQYVNLTQELYGKECMLYNVHLLNHLVDGVVNFGPLWTHNTFSFEGKNHQIMQMQTSAGRVAQQLARRYLTYNALPTLFEKYASTDAPANFVDDITGKKLKSFVRCGQCVVMGKSRAFEENDEKILAIESIMDMPNIENIASSQKILYAGVRYCTSIYCDNKKFDDSYILTSDGIRGCIQEILQVDVGTEKTIVILLRELLLDRTPILKTQNVTVTHVKRVNEWGRLIAIRPHHIQNQCIYMSIDCGKFIVDMPYGCYGD